MTLTTEPPKQPITGLTPPQIREAMIRTSWPSVAYWPAVAGLGRGLILSYVLAPLGWFLMLPFYFVKVLPVVGFRYVVTNKRVMIQTGWSRRVAAEVPLAEIDEIRIVKDANSQFFRSGTLELLSKGQVKLTLHAVKEPEVFYHAIRNACMAWVPDAPKKWLQFLPAKLPDAKEK
jgi:hypothetical protein